MYLPKPARRIAAPSVNNKTLVAYFLPAVAVALLLASGSASAASGVANLGSYGTPGLAALAIETGAWAGAMERIAPAHAVSPAPVVSLSRVAQGIDLDAVLAGVHYRQIGPTRQSGRFVSFAVDPRNRDVFYAATASGGLWKTGDGGITFESIFNQPDVFSIGAVTVAPSNPDTVWVGTGEGNNSRSSYYGNGIYKSTDAGRTWTNMGLPEAGHFARIVVHPTNANIVYAAALGWLYKDNPERGLYKSTDGGRTWEVVLTGFVPADRGLDNETERHVGVVEVVMHPEDPDTLYAATYDKVRKPWTFNPGGPGSRIWKTTNGGNNWTMLEGGLPLGLIGRIGLAISAAVPETIFAVIEDVNVDSASEDEAYQALLDGRPAPDRANIDRIWRSRDGGDSWEAVSPNGQNVGGGPPYYYGRIISDPGNADSLFMLSSRSLKSIDGGREWVRAWTGIGGDDHALWIDPDNSNYMLMGYDHGMGISRDGGENWYHPDNLPLAQFYAVGIDMVYPYNVYGGLQDNGSHRGPSTKRGGGPIVFEDWERVGRGDGMYNEIDWSNNRYLYNEFQFGRIVRLDLLTNESRSIRYSRPQGEEQLRWNWNAPIVVSRHDNNVIYHAGNVVLHSSFRGESWEEISPDLTTNDPAKIRGIGNIQYCTITALDESSIVAGLLWAGTDDGNVWVTRDAGANWTQVNQNIPNTPGYWVSRVEPSHLDPGTAYVTFTGYRRDDFRPFVYKTTDYGETWTDISAGLPNEPVNVVRQSYQNPNLLFVGTEMGVYASIDGGNSWRSMRGDMPTQPVHDMKIHPRENDLVVATHGTGIYITDISWMHELTAESLSQPVHLFRAEPKVRWHVTDRRATSAQNFLGESEPNGNTINYMLASPAAEPPTIRIYDGDRLVRTLAGSNEAGLNSVIWDQDFGRERMADETPPPPDEDRGGRDDEEDPNRPPNQVYLPAPEGLYRAVLTVDGEEFTVRVRVVDDHWWDRQF